MFAGMSKSDRIAALETRLTNIQAAIDATLARGVKSYTTEIQSLTALGLDELRRMETATSNELSRLRRGGRLGAIGFGRAR